MLEVTLRHRAGDFTLDAAFAAPPGITALFGRSGAGKSTILRAVAGLLTPEAGRISVGGRVLLDTGNGVCLPPHRRRIGTVFQDGRLFPHLSVRGNLLYGARFAPDPARARGGLDRVADLLGIVPLLDRRPGALSGGEISRVAIGRALLSDPHLILADEPLAALDAPRKAEILPVFERLRDTFDIPILYVSHSVTEVARLATTVVALEAGHVTAAGPAAEILADPAITPTGAAEAGAVIAAQVVRHHADGLTEVTAGGLPLFLPRLDMAAGAALRLRIGAGDVMLALARPEGVSALNILPARVLSLREVAAAGVLVALESRAGRLLARITARSAAALSLSPGVEVHAVVKSVSVDGAGIGAAARLRG